MFITQLSLNNNQHVEPTFSPPLLPPMMQKFQSEYKEIHWNAIEIQAETIPKQSVVWNSYHMEICFSV